MVFKTREIEKNENSLSGKKFTSIFGSNKNEINFGDIFDDEFNEQIKLDIEALKVFQQETERTGKPLEALENKLFNASEAAKEYAKNTDESKFSVADFEKKQRKAQVTIVAENKAFSNCKGIITEYNSALNNTDRITQNAGLAQTDYVEAVGQGNNVMGKYLTSLNGAKASFPGYIGYLITAKAATIGLEVATAAFNMALMAGVSFLVSKALQGLSYLINYQANVAKEAKEAAKASQEQVDAYKDNINTIDELIAKYKRKEIVADAVYNQL